MVYGTWFLKTVQTLGFWGMRSLFFVGIWYLVPGTWCLKTLHTIGFRGMRSFFFLVSGTWYLVHGTWYMVPEDIAHHRVSGDEVVVFFPGRINSWVLNDLARPRMICVNFFHCTP